MKTNLFRVYLAVLVSTRWESRLEESMRAFTSEKKAEEYAREQVKILKDCDPYSIPDYYITDIEVEIDKDNKVVQKVAMDIVSDYLGKCVLKAMGGL